MLRSSFLGIAALWLGVVAAKYGVGSIRGWFYASLPVVTLLIIFAQLLNERRAGRHQAAPPIRERCSEIIAALQIGPHSPARKAALQLAEQIASDVEDKGQLVRQVMELEATAKAISGDEVNSTIHSLKTEAERYDSAERRAFWRHLCFFVLGAAVLWLLIGMLPMAAVYFLNRWSPVPAEQPDAATSSPPPPSLGAPSTEVSGRLWKSVLEASGTFGDTFGAVNAFFSALALAGAIYSIVLQTGELRLQREEMAMNRRELTRTADAQIQAERSLELQTRLAAYQNLAEHHRYARDNAGEDILLKHRSIGRERAYAELVEVALRDLELYAAGGQSFPLARVSFTDHEARIRNLHTRYQSVARDIVMNPNNDFETVGKLLYGLLEELSALLELNHQPGLARVSLIEGGHYVNAAIRPQDAKHSLDSADDIRRFQVKAADLAFALAEEAIVVLKRPQRSTTDANDGESRSDHLLAMLAALQDSSSAG